MLGAAGKPEQDLLTDNLKSDSVPWMYRRGGGGTVVLGPGQVVLALVTEVGSPYRNREYAAEINAWIVESLSELGVSGVQPEGISDLAIRGKKIVGTSIYRTRLVLFYQASLLVDVDIRPVHAVSGDADEVLEYRRGRNHEDFCTTLRREGYTGSVSEVIAAMERVVSGRLPHLQDFHLPHLGRVFPRQPLLLEILPDDRGDIRVPDRGELPHEGESVAGVFQRRR